MRQSGEVLTKINTLVILSILAQIAFIVHHHNLMIKDRRSISFHDGIFKNRCIKVGVVGGLGEKTLLILRREGKDKCRSSA